MTTTFSAALATSSCSPRARSSATRSSRRLIEPARRAIRAVVASHLDDLGYGVAEAAAARTALSILDEAPPDLVVVDVDLPDAGGFDVLRLIRQASDAPMIVVTTRGAEIDRITGLDLGADDYVVKPLSVGELMARVRAVSRRIR